MRLGLIFARAEQLADTIRVMQPIVWGFLLMSRYPNTRVALAMSAAATVDTHPTD
jgi:hypothetical protein